MKNGVKLNEPYICIWPNNYYSKHKQKEKKGHEEDKVGVSVIVMTIGQL